MKVCMITFRSVTPAQRGEGLLRKAGIACTLVRTPRWMEEQGCGYSLRLEDGSVTAAKSLLEQAQLPYRKIYRKMEDGTMEELAL